MFFFLSCLHKSAVLVIVPVGDDSSGVNVFMSDYSYLPGNQYSSVANEVVSQCKNHLPLTLANSSLFFLYDRKLDADS